MTSNLNYIKWQKPLGFFPTRTGLAIYGEVWCQDVMNEQNLADEEFGMKPSQITLTGSEIGARIMWQFGKEQQLKMT